MKLQSGTTGPDLLTGIIRGELYKGDWLEGREAETKEAGDAEMEGITKGETLLKCQSGPWETWNCRASMDTDIKAKLTTWRFWRDWQGEKWPINPPGNYRASSATSPRCWRGGGTNPRFPWLCFITAVPLTSVLNVVHSCCWGTRPPPPFHRVVYCSQAVSR